MFYKLKNEADFIVEVPWSQFISCFTKKYHCTKIEKNCLEYLLGISPFNFFKRK